MKLSIDVKYEDLEPNCFNISKDDFDIIFKKYFILIELPVLSLNRLIPNKNSWEIVYKRFNIDISEHIIYLDDFLKSKFTTYNVVNNNIPLVYSIKNIDDIFIFRYLIIDMGWVKIYTDGLKSIIRKDKIKKLIQNG